MSNIYTLKNESRDEIYDYIDKNIKPLPKKEDGTVDEYGTGLAENDIDALRHAYTSGRYTMIYGTSVSKVLGTSFEYIGLPSANTESSKNMDLWNNAVGRKYGKLAETESELIDLLLQSLKNGELIITPSDPRKYEGTMSQAVDPNKPVVVAEESDTGLNTLFIDLVKGDVMDKDLFVSKIKTGNYKGYQIIKKGNLEFPMSKSDETTSNNLG